MVARPRIAVVATRGSDLPARVAATAYAPVVQTFADLFTDADAVRRFRPAVLVLERGELSPEDLGALKVLRGLLPDLGVVVATSPREEARVRPLVEPLAAAVLATPFTAGELTTALQVAQSGSRGHATEMLLDLVRGLSDEINNPLQMVGGHLRLLEDALAPGTPGLEQLGLVRAGLARIAATMDRLRLIVRAAEARSPQDPVDLGSLTDGVVDRLGRVSGRPLPLAVLGAPEALVVPGDADLLEAMIEELANAAAALGDAGGDARLELEPVDGGVRLRALVDASPLPAWRLPRTYDPYYLERVLRGTAQGLGLFAVQSITQAHGGVSLARWESENLLSLELHLPATRP